MNKLFDNLSAFLAKRPGLLPLLGILLIIANFVLQLALDQAVWLVRTDFLLHLGLISAIIGLLLIKPLQ